MLSVECTVTDAEDRVLSRSTATFHERTQGRLMPGRPVGTGASRRFVAIHLDSWWSLGGDSNP